MGAKLHDHFEPNATPKLSLSKLPCKPREPIQMLTPPLHPSLSIPFRWEEAPGKPRAAADVVGPTEEEEEESPAASKNKVARCLDLPPNRLAHHDARITIMPSPATVLDGPYVGRSLSLACTFSFRKGVVTGRDEGFGPERKGGGSARWGSFEDGGERAGRGNLDISHTLGEIFKSEKNVKITRVKRRRSFFNLSSVNSNLQDIYASFKHAVPWRRRR